MTTNTKTSPVIGAFLAQIPYNTVSNTRTDGRTLYLHSVAIAKWTFQGKFLVSLAGHPTKTTFRRINEILSAANSKYRIRAYGTDKALLELGRKGSPVEAFATDFNTWIHIPDVRESKQKEDNAEKREHDLCAANYFNEHGDFIGSIPQDCIDACTQAGRDATPFVQDWIGRLNFAVPRELAIAYLRDCGAWTVQDLQAETDNELAVKVLWIACGELKENGEFLGLIH